MSGGGDEAGDHATHGDGDAGHGGHEHEHHTSTPVSSRKMLMWAFIGSECMFFASLITAYLVYRGQSVTGPYPEEILNIPFITVTTFVLLMSSVTMVLALSAVQRGDDRWSKVWLFATPALGGVFLVGQYIEFSEFVHHGLTLSQNLFGSTFFVLTGFHGAHVSVAALWMFTIWFLAMRGRIGPDDSETVEIAGLYWHFVDIVWIVLFTLIYLMS